MFVGSAHNRSSGDALKNSAKLLFNFLAFIKVKEVTAVPCYQECNA